MHFSKPIFRLTLGVAGLVVSATYFAAATNEPCKVLTAEKFSQVMGYKATLNETGSTSASCFYQSPSGSEGQFMILTETASGPQADMMLKNPGSSPPPDSGLIGGSYRQGQHHILCLDPIEGPG